MTTDNKPLYEKIQIAKSFSKAALSYDSAAGLQKEAGFQLLNKLQCVLKRKPKSILDAGAGTGYFTHKIANLFPNAQIIGLDIAFGMMRFATEHHPHKMITYLTADIDQPPLASASIDCVFSNLMLQWSPQPLNTLKSIQRTISPEGYLCFSTLIQGTFFELEEAWKKIDIHPHVHPFPSASKLLQYLQEAGYRTLETQIETKILHYPNILVFFKNLKQIGAHNLQTHRAKGLSHKKTLNRLTDIFQSFYGSSNQIPATYQILYVIAETR